MLLELSLRAKDLPNVAGAFKGTSDPFVVVTELATKPGAKPRVLGKTEVIKNSLSPAWAKVFMFDYELGTPVKLAVTVYDEVRKGDNKSMGAAVFEVGSVLGARGNTKAKTLKKGGTLFATVRKSKGSGILRLRMRGIKLTNTEGIFRKSDPFYELSRKVDNAGGDTWDNVLRSKPVHDNLSPDWSEMAIELSVLCGGDLNAPIKVTVFDYEKSGDHVLMGEFETSVNGLRKSSFDGQMFKLKKKGKETGSIAVPKAELSGHESNLSEQLEETSISDSPDVSTRGIPTFVDYITGGCELNVSIAIDFTGSNGDPRQPGTLHHWDEHSNNAYEKAIMSVVSILEGYDSDKKFPVLGFGAKYANEVRHAFQCGPEPESEGVQGVLDSYRSVFRTQLIMSGPTVFKEVIDVTAIRARNSYLKASENGKQTYTILLILTDGSVSDPALTAESLDTASDAPLSVVIVGVGNADFSAMQFLDDRRGSGKRDIAQFVEFNKHCRDSVDLSSETLREIPNQLVAYFQSKGIAPLEAVTCEEEEIVVEPEEEEIDLSLDIGEEEIVVAGGGNDVKTW